MNPLQTSSPTGDAGRPWWSFAHLWMVIAGPAIVVVAASFTFYLAASAPDPVLSTQEVPENRPTHAVQLTQVPALEARNHAAAGEVPVKSVARP